MSDASAPNQASEPNQEVGRSQQAQLHSPPNPGGSAMLDAEAAAGASTNPAGEPIDHPIATNFSAQTGTGDDKAVGASTVAGPYVADDRQAEEAGVVHLQNKPDVPDSDIQGKLPDTDQIGRPTDPAVNLPD